ncbi:MAG: hypothetical protein A2042_07445 [Candidatus Schekmanbacteria bacterium GWA2_38_11]|uniref:Glycosyltransferase RgtA/B/C/D-like domain-containing protein n=1 Tax=Candidatus Schekmanbacteria bacterium GWA2_38_11 TaxID=1817876 RepID=A0A1F7RPC0_9BACT|nr:MAG: hypothetical protein A2042_07445 [Candidatus Schekmanbacteria bacterium GWA2_38_11]
MSKILDQISNFFCQRKIYFFIFIVVVYNLNLREIGAGDTTPAKYLPVSIIKEFNLNLDEFPLIYKSLINRDYAFIQYSKGHYYSSYPIMAGILALPIYFFSISLLGFTINTMNIDILSKISASFIAALSVLILFITLKRLTDEKIAFYISLIYAFGTSTWSISSQSLWQHGPSELFLILAFYYMLRGLEKDKYVVYSTLFLSLSVATRLTNTLPVLIFFIYIIQKHRIQLLKIMIFPVVVGTLLFSYNLYFFNTLTGGNAKLWELTRTTTGVTEFWSFNFLEGFLGLLISPSRGLLIYSPFFIFSFIGILIIFKDKKLPNFQNGYLLFRYTVLSISSIIFLYSFYAVWWGGYTFGPRYLTDIVPLLCIFLIFIWDRIFKSKIITILFLYLVIFSIFVHFIGAFYYPSGSWNSSPKPVNFNRERLWDWKDSQILRCVKSGFTVPWLAKYSFWLIFDES